MGNAQTNEDESFLDELKPGTELLQGQYKIEKFINSGGFGITYLATDSLARKVVIKECFPSSFCHRSRAIVQARSRAHSQELKSVVNLFVQEARSLAKLDHPNIVGVHQVFEDNETAYMVLDYVEGRDLLDILEDGGHELTPPQIKGILKDVLGAVKFIHEQDILHRDISPDNILLDGDLRPVLIDFGAAREEATKQSRVLSALRVVKDGYSPQEFYVQGSEQSPSSDLYALGATFYHLISGDIPTNSQARLAAIASGEPDPYVPLADNTQGYDRRMLEAIDKALGILPKDRVQSADEWLDALEGRRRKSRIVTAPVVMSSAAVETEMAKKKSMLVPLLGSAAAIAIIAVVGLVATGSSNSGDEQDVETAEVIDAGGATDADIAAAEAEAAVLAAEQAAAEEEAIRLAEIAAAEAEIAAAEAEARQAELAVAAEARAEREAEIAAVTAEAERQAEIAAAEAEAARLAEVAAAEAEEAAFKAEIAAAEAEAARLADIAEAQAQEELQAEEAQIAKLGARIPEPRSEEDVVAFNEAQESPVVATNAPDALEQPVADTEAANAPGLVVADTAQSPVGTLRLALPDQEGTPFVDGTIPDKPVAVAQSEADAPVDFNDTGVLTAWSVELPFDTEAGTNVISDVAVISPLWAEKGAQIVAINSTPVASMDDLGDILRGLSDPADQINQQLTFSVLPAAGGDIELHDWQMPVVQKTILLNGMSFETKFEGEAWKTVVTSVPEGTTDLLVGDTLIALMSTSEPLDGRTSLRDVLAREVATGATEFSFAVSREGSMWIAAMTHLGGA